MSPSNKLLVVHPENRIIRIQEFRVKEDFDSIRSSVEQLNPSNLIEDRIVRVVGHVVRGYGRKGGSTKGEDSSFEENLVFFREERFGVGNFSSLFSAGTRTSVLDLSSMEREGPTQCIEQFVRTTSLRFDSGSP